MNINELISYMKLRPWSLTQGAATVAKRTHSSELDVRKARSVVRSSRSKNKQHSVLMLSPRILIFDVETAPMEAYVWRLWKLNIAFDHVIEEWYMICWSAKWLYSGEVIGDVLTPEEALVHDDKRIMLHLWELINKADIVIAYNGRKADIPWMNTRFILNGIKPPKPYILIDPCEVARKAFGFPSNKLDALAKYFGYDAKLDTDFDLWVKCIHGDALALKYMLEYNKRDVTLLEEVYLKLRPWIKNHPNCSNILEQDKLSCCTCSSTNIEEIPNEYYFTQVGKYKLYRCKDCGSVFRGRKNQHSNTIETISTLR